MATSKKKKGGTALSAKDEALLDGLDAAYADKPDLPVANILQEARELGATMDKLGSDLVKGSDLAKGAAKDLDARRARLDVAEAVWSATRSRGTPTVITAAREDGESQKRDAFEALRYYLRDEGEVQLRLDEIAQGSGDADLVDDLKKLADLLEESGPALANADLPKKAPDALRAAAEALSGLAADRAVDPVSTKAQDLRNRAYWHLRHLMDEIRAAGRYVYRRDKKLVTAFRASLTRARARRRHPGGSTGSTGLTGSTGPVGPAS
ncbi:MAG TPA: hypothetical protein VH044_20790 [Polyangiaceae bacterium]|jgi:hypothetical protein|nr:hypothetical protein [Polyangiaceae bacterium]